MEVAKRCRELYPGACFGWMVVNNAPNRPYSAALEEHKRRLEQELRKQYASRGDLLSAPHLEPYTEYYRRFRKSYQVMQQIESVALKDKTIPAVAVLVEAMFMAELKNGILTAGHDYRQLQLPVRIDAACGNEEFLRIDRSERRVKAGDMMAVDGAGVIASVVYGPDYRTRIHAGTDTPVYIAYAPPGIGAEAMYAHLGDILEYVQTAVPEAKAADRRVVTAS